MSFRSCVRLAVGLLWVAHAVTLYAMTGHPNASLVSNLLQLVVVALAAVACAFAAWRTAGFSRQAATLASAACWLWAAGQAGYIYYDSVRNLPIPPLSVADVAFYSFYFPLAVILFLFPAEDQKRDWLHALDFAQIAIFLGAVYIYFFLFLPSISVERGKFLERGTLNAWDAVNLVLLGLFLYRGFTTRHPGVRKTFLRFGKLLALYAIGDWLNSYGRVILNLASGTWIDLSYTIPFGLAAILASDWKEVPTEWPVEATARRVTWKGNLFPAVPPALVLLMAGHMSTLFPLAALLAVAASVGCLVLRMALMQNRQEMTVMQLRTVQEANLALTKSLELHVVLNTLLENMSRLVPYDTANVMLVEGDELVVRAVSGYEKWTPHRVLGMRFDPDRIMLWAEMLRGKSMVVADTFADPRWVVMEETKYVRSWLAVPLIGGNQIIGFYSFDKAVPGFFTAEHMRIAESLAAQAAVAVQNARLYEQQRAAERALSLAQEKFSKAFYSHPNPMVISALDGTRIIDVNPSYEHYFGYSREELLSGAVPPAAFYAHPGAREMLRQKILAEGKLAEQEVELRTKQGEVRSALASAELMEVAGERYILGVIRDITDRRRAEEALVVSELRFSKAFHSSPIPMVIVTLPHLKYAEVNDSFIRLVGYAREEVLGSNESEAGITANPARAAELLEKIQTEGNFFGEPYTIRTRSGDLRELLISAEAIDFSGMPHALVTGVDVTEFRRIEDRFQKAFRASPIPMSISTLDEGRYVDVNDAYLRTTGFDRESVIGRTAFELNIWARPEQRAELVNLLRLKDRLQNWEMELQTCNGQTRTMLLSAELVDLGGKKHLLSALLDLTEHRHLEEQLRQSQKMEAIGRLAGGVAHDFNNLLMVIIGRCDLALTRLKARDAAAASVEEAQRAAWKAASLTRQLLAFSRKQVLQPQTLNLNTLTSNLQKLLQRMIGEDILFSFRPAPDLGQVKADPGGIEQILMNLCVNARDAMPHGGRLTIETSNIELDESYVMRHGVVTPGRYAVLAVSDTGVGMSAATQARIFEPFFTTKEAGKGTGLGLSTVYGIVKQSGGFVWVYSEPGQGATFKIYLPRVDAPAEAMTEEERAPSISRGAETLLLVEDDPQVRELTSEFLRGAGYNVLVSANGKDGLALASNHNGDIRMVITDVVMPGLGGREMVTELKTHRPALKVIYLSGYADEAVISHGELPYGDAFLQKPFRMSDLANRIREVLDA